MPGIQTAAPFATVEPGKLRIITSDIEVRPMSFLADGERQGFEPALTRTVCDRLQLEPVWFDTPLKNFYKTLSTGDFDVVWFNQIINQERRAWADFTRPYGRFNTAVLVPESSEIEQKSDLNGKRIGTLRESFNSQILDLLPSDIEPIYFEGHREVRAELLDALHKGMIDAIVEDSLILMATEAQNPTVRVAFELQTQHPFGIGVLPGNRELLDALNTVLSSLIIDGTLNRLWGQWIPYKSYPF